MTDIATLIADMVKAGVDPELIGRTAAALSQREPVRVVDEQAERRRAADRARKRLRNSAETADSAEKDTLSSPEVSPQTPFPKPHLSNPPSPPLGGSSPAESEAEFAEFWAVYPNKVGKPDAKAKFAKARLKADLSTIMDGLRRYVAKTDDRPWCNPATWLHQERWGDAPATAPPARGSPQQSSRPPTAAEILKHRREQRQSEDDHPAPGTPRLIASR